MTQIEFSRAEVGSGVAIVMLAYGILLVLMARGVFLGRRWSRGPAAATQLILLPIAFSFRASPTTAVALVIAGVAVGTLIGLLHPRSTEVFVGPVTAAGCRGLRLRRRTSAAGSHRRTADPRSASAGRSRPG